MTLLKYKEKEVAILELTDREQARMRVAVFFGSSTNYRHSFIEILGNSIDEAMKGFGDKIEITLSHNGTRIKIKDYANGLPVEQISESGTQGYIALLETLFAGTKYEQGENYSLGLNGVGLATTILTSTYAKVTVGRPDGNIYQVEYTEGIRNYDMKIIGQTGKTFTEVEWTCDKKVFSDNVFDWEDIKQVAESQASINKVLITCKNEDLDEYKEFYFEEGIKELLENTVTENKIIDNLYYNLSTDKEIIKNENKLIDKIKMDIAFTFTNKGEVFQKEFLNSSDLTYFGTIQNGVVAGFRNSINRYLRDNNLYQAKEKQITIEDIQLSLNYIIDFRSLYPEFENQIKKKTLVPHFKDASQEMIEQTLEIFFIENPVDTEKMCKQILVNKRAREKSSKMMQNISKKLSEEITVLNKPEGLIDCVSKNVDENRLFICEGLSAKGSLIQARNSNIDALYSIRGKILNCLKADYDVIFKNDIVTNIIRILGCGVEIKTKENKEFMSLDLEKLKYGKIIIATDADVDGFNIRTLLLTMFYRLMPTLITEGKIWIVEAPLFEIECGDDVYYAVNETEKNEILEKLKGKKYTINRNKGLGEMNPDVCSDTMMRTDYEGLYQVKITDMQEATEYFELFMGESVAPRREYITNNFNKYDFSVIS